VPIITKWGETLKKEWENLNIQSNDMKCGDGFQNLLDRIEKHDGNIEQQAQTAFENYLGDCFAIYQIKLDRELYAKFAFQSYATITADGHSPKRAIYNLVYAAAVHKRITPEDIFYIFNMEQPADYRGHSLSVSDVVAIKEDGQVTYYYCDCIGFKMIPGFLG
jgi:hypothetical protein